MRCSSTQKIIVSATVSIILVLFLSDYYATDEFECRDILNFLNISTHMLIWDPVIIAKIEHNERCTIGDFSEKMAMPVNTTINIYPFLTFESTSKTNYYIIHRAGEKHGIHKKYWHGMRRLLFPTNFTLLEELWKRSQMIGCLDLKVERNETAKHGWDEEFALNAMEGLTHHFVSHGMFPFLADGTLLGWYRECTFIPHTKDVDFAYMAEEYNQVAFDQIIEKQTEFRPLYRYGQHLVDLEYTVFPSKKKDQPHVDFFQINFNGNSSYSSCFRGRTRIVFTYPTIYDPYCAADFRGRLFWVTCHPDLILTSMYGDYRKDHPTSKFSFDRDSKNFHRAHTYTELEWKTTMFKFYRD